jgi:hypothetical protein
VQGGRSYPLLPESRRRVISQRGSGSRRGFSVVSLHEAPLTHDTQSWERFQADEMVIDSHGPLAGLCFSSKGSAVYFPVPTYCGCEDRSGKLSPCLLQVFSHLHPSHACTLPASHLTPSCCYRNHWLSSQNQRNARLQQIPRKRTRRHTEDKDSEAPPADYMLPLPHKLLAVTPSTCTLRPPKTNKIAALSASPALRKTKQTQTKQNGFRD